MALTSTCHPSKRHHARGLCHECYVRDLRGPATCHPDKTATTRAGLCGTCYHKTLLRPSLCHPERSTRLASGQCNTCYKARHYRKNRARYLERAALRDKDALRARSRAWHRDNRERHIKAMRAYRRRVGVYGLGPRLEKSKEKTTRSILDDLGAVYKPEVRGMCKKQSYTVAS